MPTGHLNAKRMPLRCHEDILIFSYANPSVYNPQGIVPCNKIVRRGGNGRNYTTGSKENLQEFTNYPRSILKFSRDSGNFHPTQKPIALMEYLINTYTNPGDVVLDFTMGSGSTGVACVNTGRKFIGIERNKKYFKIAKSRIKDAQKYVKYAN